MRYKNWLTGLLVMLITFNLSSQVMSVSASIKLKGPATKEQTDEVRGSASKKIKSEIVYWLEEHETITLDTLNPLQNHILEILVDTCLNRTKEESSFLGKTLTLTYNLTDDMIRNSVQSFNTTMDENALRSWGAMVSARDEKNWKKFYREAVMALAFSTAHLGPPLPTPQAEGRDLSDDIRLSLNDFFKRLKITSSDMILWGQAGQLVKNPPVITVVIDSLPVEGLGFTVIQQNGTKLFSAITDVLGQITFSDMKIPFVANGTLVYVKIDPGIIIDPSTFMDARNFGLRNGPEQTFIFKLSRPEFTLEYKATAVSKLSLPPDFTSNVHIKKFLTDSCYMQEVSGGKNPDLAIFVQSQISSYNYDDTEQVGLKVQSQITVKGLKLNPPRTEQEQVIFEKRYEQKIELPFGLFLWEANSRVRQAITAAMNRM